MKNKLRTYESAIRYAKACRKLKIAIDLQDQLNRASASVALNLAEGSAGSTEKERHRYYRIALQSLRETEAILEIAEIKDQQLLDAADLLGGSLYNLCRSTSSASS